MPKNLWGDLPNIEEVKPPVAILKEQAAGLEKLTKGILTAEVHVSQSYGRIHLDFRIIAPALSGYEYSLLTAEHDIEMYPVKVMPATGSYSDLVECRNSEEFEETLCEIFTSQKTHRIIQSLMAQSKA